MRDGKILPYLDIPLQHASPRILKLMKRPGPSSAPWSASRSGARSAPRSPLRSTFIVGFPARPKKVPDAAGLHRQGGTGQGWLLQIQPGRGAKANELPDPVPAEVQEERFQRFMELQQQVPIRKLARKVGKEMLVLIDEVDEEVPPAARRRCPEIDGLVYLNGETGLKARRHGQGPHRRSGRVRPLGQPGELNLPLSPKASQPC